MPTRRGFDFDGQAVGAALDGAFSDDVDEIIERVLLAFRPILCQAVMASFRDDLQLAIQGTDELKAWLAVGPPSTVRGVGPLTAGQVALLGGTRPTRVLQTVASRLWIPLDGGDKQSLREADRILTHSSKALESVVEHHVVSPARGQEARLRKLRGLVRVGVAAQFAAMMGALHEHHLWAEERALEEERELVQRYFLGALQAFGRIKLARRDQDVFRDHYLEARDIEEIADERGVELAAEAERRRGFLERLAAALEAQAAVAAGHDAGAGDPEALAGAGDAGPRALTRATGRATRPRRR